MKLSSSESGQSIGRRFLPYAFVVICAAASLMAQALSLWTPVADPVFPPALPVPTSFSAATLDEAALAGLLESAPPEGDTGIPLKPIVPILLPDGSLAEVAAVETQVLERALAALFPTIKAYSFEGVSDPSISGKLVQSEVGVYVVAQHQGRLVRIDPFEARAGRVYLSYFDQDRTDGSNVIEHPHDEHPEGDIPPVPSVAGTTIVAAGPITGNWSIGDTLRVYRLAAATTGEFFQAREQGFGALGVLFSLAVDVMGINAIFEPELGVRLVISLASLSVFYDDPTTDPFVTVDDPTTMNVVEGSPCDLRGQNRTNSVAVLDDGDYDLGFLFATQGGGGSAGCAWYNLCREGAGVLHKSAAAGRVGGNGTNSAVGIVLHESGHQLGANHTYSGLAGGCDLPNFSENPMADPTAPPGSAMEPGSGSTIMSYSGICADQAGMPPPPPPPPLLNDNVDLTGGNDSYYHTMSFHQIREYIENGDGGTCGTPLPTGNSAPTSVDAGPDFTIPRQTPFTLQGLPANDADPLTYNWEQIDLATVRRNIDTDISCAVNPVLCEGPIVRSYPPGPSTDRTIPRIEDLVTNTTRAGEILPQVDREMNFRYTARDGRIGGGGVEHDEMVLTVQGSPFFLTSPNGGESLAAGCPVPVTWVVGGGNVAANVDISLSTDGGFNFSTVLLAATPNDGDATANLTCDTTNNARIKAMASDNIFFDISNNDFSVSLSPPTVDVSAAGGSVDDACEFLVTFEASAVDDCGIDAGDVSLSFFKQADNYTLGVPAVNKVQEDATTVSITGSVLVSDVSSSPAVLRIEIDAADQCGAASNDFVEIEIVDDIPPMIMTDLAPDMLWPPNHKMADVLATVVATDNCPGVSFVLTSVTSDEPDEGLGDGDFPDDIQGVDIDTPELEFQLRAERSGLGDGRTYTAVYTATDASDNEAEDSDTVEVPKSRKPN